MIIKLHGLYGNNGAMHHFYFFFFSVTICLRISIAYISVDKMFMLFHVYYVLVFVRILPI